MKQRRALDEPMLQSGTCMTDNTRMQRDPTQLDGRRPTVSFVIASHNRKDVLLATLQRICGGRRTRGDHEVIVVDNRSVDGTAEAVRLAFPNVILLCKSSNLGSCAKAFGVDRARGEYVVFLDDDSHPAAGSVDRMIRHFQADPRLGAAGFRVFLPDGREECSAFPNVFIGCGVGFRAAALREVGGLDRTLFMAAEEYDLSFRLIQAGWRVKTFDDIHVDHLKTVQGRRGARPIYHDTRNNLLVAARYLDQPLWSEVRRDWMQRYRWLAGAERRILVHLRASLIGRLMAARDRRRFVRWRLGPDAVETLFRFRFVNEHMRRLASRGIERIVFADLGKNVLAFHRAARDTGLDVLAIGDDRFFAPGRRYRGIPIVPLSRALGLRADAAVVSNTSPVHAARTARAIANLVNMETHCWFAAAPASREVGERPAVPRESRTEHGTPSPCIAYA